MVVITTTLAIITECLQSLLKLRSIEIAASIRVQSHERPLIHTDCSSANCMNFNSIFYH